MAIKRKKRKYTTATVRVKRTIWTGRIKVLAGKTFQDDRYYEGKYHEDIGEVISKPEEPEEPEDKKQENDLSKILK